VWVWASVTVLFFLLRVAGPIHSVPLCVYLSAIAGAFCFSVDQLRAVGPAHPLLRLRQLLLVVVLVAIPPLIDPSTGEIENLPRLVVIVVAAVMLLAIWAVDAVWNGWRPRRLVNGFQWVLLAIVVWFGVTTLTSVEPRLSLLGRYGSYEGFILLAALAVLTSGLAESFTFEALPALFRVVVASTMPVVVYGLIQIYGFDVNKHSPWDFIHWHAPFHNVFATFGNPNHLGGYIATVLPLGVVTAVLARRRWARVAMWGWVAVVLLLLLQTAARGAWLGTLVGGVVLVIGLLPRLRARARTVFLAAGVAVVVAVVLVSAGSRFLGAKASALLRFGSGSSVSQRPQYWLAAIHSASHHLIFGTGPDTWADTYSRYQSATLAKQIGLATYVDGAHNIFFSWLSNEGVLGLLLLVVLFAVGLAWGVRAWRSLRVGSAGPETTGSPDPSKGEPRRYIVAALVAGLVGYIVQASFDIEQAATLFALFVGLGFLGVVNRGVQPVADLVSPLAAFRSTRTETDAPTADDDPEYPIRVTRQGAYGRSAAQARDHLRRVGAVVAVGVVGLTAVGLTYWRADAMWRADHQAWHATPTALARAIKLNPWEPSYFFMLGRQDIDHYLQFTNGAPGALPDIEAAVGYLSRGVALDSYSTDGQAEYGAALFYEGRLEHSKPVLRVASAAFRQAKQDDPFNNAVNAFVKDIQKLLRSG
jgi:O-antigen ligase